MKKIKGTNLGNWLVLERWMQEDIFRKTDAPDETWLYRKGDLPEIEKEIILFSGMCRPMWDV